VVSAGVVSARGFLQGVSAGFLQNTFGFCKVSARFLQQKTLSARFLQVSAQFLQGYVGVSASFLQ
jgi:hypothetical protein